MPDVRDPPRGLPGNHAARFKQRIRETREREAEEASTSALDRVDLTALVIANAIGVVVGELTRRWVFGE